MMDRAAAVKAARPVSDTAMHNIALLGAGLIGREHARLLHGRHDMRVSVVADPAPAAREFADSIGAAWMADYVAALDEHQPDGAIVALPNQLHLPAGAACLERKVVPLIEKPLTGSLDEARELLHLEAVHETPILVGHQRRHSPDMVRARQLVGEGKLGRLVVVNGMWFTRKHDAYFEHAWRREPGGSMLWINLIHEIDCLRYLCGEIESVSAVGSNAVRGLPVEDTAVLTIRFANGALGTLAMSDSVPSPFIWDVASGQALYLAHQPADCFHLGGTKGTLAVPSMNLWSHVDDGDWRDPLARVHMSPGQGDCYVRQLDHFAQVLAGRERPLVTCLEAARTVAVVLAAEESIRLGTTVQVPRVGDEPRQNVQAS